MTRSRSPLIINPQLLLSGSVSVTGPNAGLCSIGVSSAGTVSVGLGGQGSVRFAPNGAISGLFESNQVGIAVGDTGFGFTQTITKHVGGDTIKAAITALWNPYGQSPSSLFAPALEAAGATAGAGVALVWLLKEACMLAAPEAAPACAA